VAAGIIRLATLPPAKLPDSEHTSELRTLPRTVSAAAHQPEWMAVLATMAALSSQTCVVLGECDEEHRLRVRQRNYCPCTRSALHRQRSVAAHYVASSELYAAPAGPHRSTSGRKRRDRQGDQHHTERRRALDDGASALQRCQFNRQPFGNGAHGSPQVVAWCLGDRRPTTLKTMHGHALQHP